jgi:hypothetical protein
MYRLRTLLNWGWCPVLITTLAVIGYIYQLPIEAVVPSLIVILGIGLVVTVIGARQKEVEISVLRLRQLAEYFNSRFMGNSSLSIFAIIDGLFAIDNPKLWDWARACTMAQRIFNTWSNSFIGRLGSDLRPGRSAAYLPTYLNELWSIVNHYHEFVEQFHEVVEKIEVPREILDQYNRFVMEYNAFAQDFRNSISELRRVTRTGIEPASVRLARELVKNK